MLSPDIPPSGDNSVQGVASAGVIIIYVPDGFGNARVAKLDGNGKFLKRGVRDGHFLPLRSRFLNLQKSVSRLSRRVNLTVD